MPTTTTAKPLHCRLGRHKYLAQYNDSGEKYYECRDCGKFWDPYTGNLAAYIGF